VETANREYRALSQTLRDRLINVIVSKKSRLNKEKEALEISDASALLLHPNQFSITNPSSPGGAHGKRATRQRREMEEMTFENKKRKRIVNDDDGSPAPQRRAPRRFGKRTDLLRASPRGRYTASTSSSQTRSSA